MLFSAGFFSRPFCFSSLFPEMMQRVATGEILLKAARKVLV
ncbi:hypothetical protein CSB66_0323 [Enterobacter hormaechei]|nr:hypothetical protein CSB66_0323 [Enterobacter hormaechei]CDL33545.1 hypothetical protein [Enterobacter hormaechei]